MNSALALGKPLNYSVSSLIKMGIIPFTTELQHNTHLPIFIVTDSNDIYCDSLVQTTLAFFVLVFTVPSIMIAHAMQSSCYMFMKRMSENGLLDSSKKE